MKIYVLASGSKGNATVIESHGHVIQIDMGISLRALNERLKQTTVSFCDIEALLLTHSHTDHISNAHRFPCEMIYCSKGTYDVPSCNILSPYESFELKGFKITVLPTSHDAKNSIGFVIEDGEEKLVYMTDTGYISQKNLKYMDNPNYIVIESNHNVRMLMNTNRPMSLIRRILGDEGHLSNEDSALYISDIIGNRTKEIVLAHLSEEANTAEEALKAYRRVLKERHVDISELHIQAASQNAVVAIEKAKQSI